MNDKHSNLPKLYCINFTQWKKKYIKQFLSHQHEVIFVSSAQSAIKKGFDSTCQLVTWASKDQTDVAKLIHQFAISPWYIEDGFIRSAGLGSDLTAPASLVVDTRGIYYDPTKTSDLEHILLNKTYHQDELERAKKLAEQLITAQVSKYNLGKRLDPSRIRSSKEQTIILIPGQVEDDASIFKGCVDINNNAALLQEVRRLNPDAYLIYKPHPDVVSGNRKGAIDKEILDKSCDLVLDDVSITECLDHVDQVHTMTSLVGFEGLIRKLHVSCYGIPFYSGWGLTTDRHSCKRRIRKRKLGELLAATLIDYPMYMDWSTRQLTQAENIIVKIEKEIDSQGGKSSEKDHRLKRMMRKVLNYISGVLIFK